MFMCNVGPAAAAFTRPEKVPSNDFAARLVDLYHQLASAQGAEKEAICDDIESIANVGSHSITYVIGTRSVEGTSRKTTKGLFVVEGLDICTEPQRSEIHAFGQFQTAVEKYFNVEKPSDV